MARSRRGRVACLGVALIGGALASGCATGSAGWVALREAVDVPVRFEPVDAALRLTPGDTLAGEGCLNPLVDPRDGSRLTLERSAVSVGLYLASPGRYGLEAGEGLRIECNTGRATGIVRR